MKKVKYEIEVINMDGLELQYIKEMMKSFYPSALPTSAEKYFIAGDIAESIKILEEK